MCKAGRRQDSKHICKDWPTDRCKDRGRMDKPNWKIKIRNHKKAQVTLFIIIGLLLVIIVIVLIFIAKLVNESQEKRSTKEATETSASLQPLSDYVESCIETSAKKALEFVSDQSGYIYTNQKGDKQRLVAGFYVEHRGNQIPFRIQPPVSGEICKSGGEYQVKLETYPYISGGRRYDYASCFGRVVLFNLERIEKSMEKFIEGDIDDSSRCDFSNFKGLKIDKRQSTVNIESKESSTIFTVNYPLKVTDSSGAESSLSNFRTELKFSLNPIIEFSNTIMQKDTSDPRYDIKDGDSRFSVNVVEVAGGDDIVVIESQNIDFYGEKFQMIFARKNRKPILEFYAAGSELAAREG